MGVMNAGGYDQALAQRLLEQNVPLEVLRERIRQLEDLNAKLAAEVDRMRPVVETAIAWRHRDQVHLYLEAVKLCDNLNEAIDAYEAGNPNEQHHQRQHQAP